MADRTKVLFKSVVLAALTIIAAAPRHARAQPAGAAPAFACENAYEGGKRSDYFGTPLFQGADGWFFRLGSDLTDSQTVSPDAVAKVARVSEILAKRGTTLVYLPVPTRGVLGQKFLPAAAADGVVYDPELAVRSHVSYVDAMRKAGVAAVDLASPLKSAPPKEQLSLARDLHWTPEGARWTAFTARRAFDELPGFPELPKMKFETSSLGAQAYTSNMYDALSGVCGTQASMAEKVNGYETKRVGATADDLLGGDSSVSPVALVGSSFSDIKVFNFEGFLSEALETEVANFAISGGGQFAALYKWALTEGQKPETPKFLVWELPVYDRVDDKPYLIMFRQIIAAVHGPCSDAFKKLPSQEFNLDSREPKRIEIPAGIKLEGDDVALRFSTAGQSLQRLGLELEYGNGESELLNLVQPERVDTLNTFEIALNDEMDGGLTALTVRGFNETAVSLSVDVCDFKGEKS
jgi:alginate biosynthesis protein AlgX